MEPGRLAGDSRILEGTFPQIALEHDRKGVEQAEARRNLGLRQVSCGRESEWSSAFALWTTILGQWSKPGTDWSKVISKTYSTTLLLPDLAHNVPSGACRQLAPAWAGAATGTGWTVGPGFPERLSLWKVYSARLACRSPLRMAERAAAFRSRMRR